MVEIYVLNDDRCHNKAFLNIHGFSLFINADGYKFLFDVGQNNCYIKNAIKLNLDLSKVNCIVLSHGHYDHTNGLVNFMDNINVICHPSCTDWRKSKRTGEYNGMPINKQEFEKKFNVIYSKQPYRMSKNIYFLGEIERLNDFECKKFPSVIRDGSDDIALDDTGIVIVTNNGLIVISGCSHSGICNTIEYAKKVTGISKVYAVLGGFHLKEIDNQTEKTIEYFKQNNIKEILLGHCTSNIVCDYFKEKLHNGFNVKILETGIKFVL